jgi:hypothetical protein
MKRSIWAALAIILIGCGAGAVPADAQGFLGSIGSKGSDPGQLNGSSGIAIDTANNGNIVVADTNNNRIEVFSASGNFVRAITSPGGIGHAEGQFNGPVGVAIDIANGSNIVFVDQGNNRIDVFSATGSFIRSFGNTGAGALDAPFDVAVDAANGGNVLVADWGSNRIVVFSATGQFIRAIGDRGSGVSELQFPQAVAVDTANGSNVLVADNNNRIAVFSSTGSFIRSFGSSGSGDGQLVGAIGIAVDLANESNVLVSDNSNGRITVFSATGSFIKNIGGSGSGNGQLLRPYGIAIDTANGNNLIVADSRNDRIEVFGDAATVSPLVAAILPGGRSVQLRNPATVFATTLNGSGSPLDGCRIGLLDPGATLDYQTTDPVTNALTGQPDTPVTISAHGHQSFLLTIQGSAAQTLTAWPLLYGCTGISPTSVIAGVNTIDLTLSATPIADIVALAATAGADGILTVPFSQGAPAAFAVAAINVGADGDGLTASVDTGAATLPLTLTLCQTNPATSQCLAPPAPSVPVSIAAGATPTFSVFVSASGQVPFAPGTSRIFLRFLDSGNDSHGSTSVAVQTQ